MEQEKNKNGVIALLIIIIVILLALAVLLATGTISLKNNNGINSVDQITVAQVKSFLINNNLISTHDVVASNMPDGYAFLNDAKFAYYNQDFYRQFTESEENRLISFIGTYEIQDNKLILHVSKEEYAVGGKISEGPPYPVLSDFTKEVKNVNKTIEYTISKIDDTSEYMPFISLMQNDNEIKWYSLPGVPTYVKTIQALAKYGYGDSKTTMEETNELDQYWQFYEDYPDGSHTIYELKMSKEGTAKYCVWKANSGNFCEEGTYNVKGNIMIFDGKIVSGIPRDENLIRTFIRENDTMYEDYAQTYSMSQVNKEKMQLIKE